MEQNKIIDGIQYSIAAIIFRDDKILMFKREGEEWETGWEFVKGAIHHGENEKQAVFREVAEEAGIKIKIIKRLPGIYWGEKPYKNGKLRINSSVYLCKYISGEVRLGEPEHVDYKWMNLEEAMSNVWMAGGEKALKKAHEIYMNT